jgi:predicted GNAT family N-acyltransferase
VASDAPPGTAVPWVLRPARWERDRTALEEVRRRVFIGEQGVPEAEEWDAADPGAWHVLALGANRDPVGTGRLEATGKIGRIAVLPDFRGTGIGAAMVRHLVNHATEIGFTRVYLHAQAAATGFYERLGFRAVGPVFDEVGIPHVRMNLGIECKDEHGVGRDGHAEDPLHAR